MKLKRLTLTNFRIFEQATFDFQPGMNLLVGINGAGKSSVLDALRIVLSRALPLFTPARSRALLRKYDVTVGRDALTAELHFATSDIPFICEVERFKEKQAGRRLSLVRLKPSSRKIFKLVEESREKPLALYYSPHRSLSTAEAPDVQTRTWNQTAAFAKALLRRRLRLREFAEWWLVQKTLSQEQASSTATRRLEVLADAVKQFLEDYTNLRAVGDPEASFTWDRGAKYDGEQLPTLLLDKNDMTLDVRQLSDGERGLLALVFDLVRRLALANPELDDPLRDSEAVVLIDELDLHLHPRWQRTVVEKLIKTFPNCQFIATTHSPFIIQSLEPGQLINLESKNSSEEYADKSIEDIAESVMGTPMPQKSKRYQDMMKTAEQYFRLLRSTHPSSSKDKEDLKRRLDELSIPFSDDPAYMALLKVEREAMLGEDDS